MKKKNFMLDPFNDFGTRHSQKWVLSMTKNIKNGTLGSGPKIDERE